MEYCYLSQTVAAAFFTAGSHVSDQLSSSSSSVNLTVQQATGVGTPPLFVHLHSTTVYDHRPGVPAEPRQSPEGGL